MTCTVAVVYGEDSFVLFRCLPADSAPSFLLLEHSLVGVVVDAILVFQLRITKLLGMVSLVGQPPRFFFFRVLLLPFQMVQTVTDLAAILKA